MLTEQDLRTALQTATPPPSDTTVNALIAKALLVTTEELHWRQRGIPLLAAAAALVLILAPITVVRGYHHRPLPATAPATSAPATSAPVPRPTRPATQPPGVTMTPQALVQTLLDLLPRPGKVQSMTGRFMDGFLAAEVVYDDGHGPAELSLSMRYPAAGPEGQRFQGPVISSCLEAPQGPCTRRADGSIVTSSMGYEYPDMRALTLDWQASVNRPREGIALSLDEWNSASEKDKPISRPKPPLSIAEVVAILSSPRWQSSTITPSFAAKTKHLFTALRL